MKRYVFFLVPAIMAISCTKDYPIDPIVGHWQTIKIISPKIEYNFLEGGALCVTDTVEHCNLIWENHGYTDRKMHYQLRDDKTGMLMETWHVNFVNLILEVDIVPADPDQQPYIIYLEK